MCALFHIKKDVPWYALKLLTLLVRNVRKKCHLAQPPGGGRGTAWDPKNERSKFLGVARAVEGVAYAIWI